MEHLEKIIGKTFSDINCTNVFLGQSPKATEIKISKWDRIPGLTNFAQQRKHKKKNTNLQNGRKYLQMMSQIRA